MRGGPARCTLGAKAVDNGGLRYGAMESALRPPLPTATQALAELQIQPGLDQRLPAKHHRRDPRKQTPSGRHQIGIPAGFKSESVAGFLLECVAGFVGIRKSKSATALAKITRTREIEAEAPSCFNDVDVGVVRDNTKQWKFTPEFDRVLGLTSRNCASNAVPHP